jgi:hypothetical protein
VSLVRDELVRSIQRYGDELLAAALTVIALVEIAFSGGSETQRFLAGAGSVVIGLAAARRSRQPLLLLAGMVGVSAAAAVFPQLGGDTLASVFFVFLRRLPPSSSCPSTPPKPTSRTSSTSWTCAIASRRSSWPTSRASFASRVSRHPWSWREVTS